MKSQTALIVLLALLLTASQLVAQTEPAEKPSELEARDLAISFVPQYLFNAGLRMDIEKRLQKDGHWLLLGPQIYMDMHGDSEDEVGGIRNDHYNEMVGVGLEVYHKMFVNKEKINPFGAYFSYGATYRFHHIKFDGEDYHEYTEDGLEYVELIITEGTETINRVGINATVGLQTEVSDFMVADFFIGAGLHYSFLNSDITEEREFNRQGIFWDYGYSGTVFVGGLRIGVLL